MADNTPPAAGVQPARPMPLSDAARAAMPEIVQYLREDAATRARPDATPRKMAAFVLEHLQVDRDADRAHLPQGDYVSLHVYRTTGPGGAPALVRKVVHHTRCAVLGNVRWPTVVVGDPMPWPDAEQLLARDGHERCQQCIRRRLYRPSSRQGAPVAVQPINAPPTHHRPLPIAVHPGRYRTYSMKSHRADDSTSHFYLCRECDPALPWGARPVNADTEQWSGWVSHPAMGVSQQLLANGRPVVTDRFRHDQWHISDAAGRQTRDARFEETVRALFTVAR